MKPVQILDPDQVDLRPPGPTGRKIFHQDGGQHLFQKVPRRALGIGRIKIKPGLQTQTQGRCTRLWMRRMGPAEDVPTRLHLLGTDRPVKVAPKARRAADRSIGFGLIAPFRAEIRGKKFGNGRSLWRTDHRGISHGFGPEVRP